MVLGLCLNRIIDVVICRVERGKEGEEEEELQSKLEKESVSKAILHPSSSSPPVTSTYMYLVPFLPPLLHISSLSPNSRGYLIELMQEEVTGMIINAARASVALPPSTVLITTCTGIICTLLHSHLHPSLQSIVRK